MWVFLAMFLIVNKSWTISFSITIGRSFDIPSRFFLQRYLYCMHCTWVRVTIINQIDGLRSVRFGLYGPLVPQGLFTVVLKLIVDYI